jgi:hypothetical protein
VGSKPYPLLVSFYTNDWIYPDHARRLERECRDLGLDYLIEKRPSTRSYLKNTCIKPQFILDCLRDRSVLWVDVDASIYKRPDFFLDGDFDFQAKRIEKPDRRRTWHVGTMCFAPNDKVREFLADWISRLRVTDESALEQTWRDWKDKISTREIPKTYFEIEPNEPTTDCVIYHRLSRGQSKQEENQIAIEDEERNG